MVKRKYTAHDVAASVASIRAAALGCWLANAYDADEAGRAVALRFNKSARAVERDGGAREGDVCAAESEKVVIVLESGARAHRTRVERRRVDGEVSALARAVRTRARTKRLSDVRQLGRDRAIDFCFGSGDTACHVILELYGRGNVVVTDANYTVAALARTHRDDEKGVKILVNHPYPLERFREWRQYEREDVVSALMSGDVRGREGAEGADEDDASTRRAPSTVREALCRGFGYSPAIAEHVALTAGIENGSSATLPFPEDAFDSRVDGILSAVRELETWFEDVTTGARFAEAHVYTKKDVKADGTDEIEVVDDFSPFALKQYEGRPTKTYEMPKDLDPALVFDYVVDEYFAELESQSLVLARRKAEAQAIAKLEKALKDQQNRVEQLERERELEEQRAILIEYHHEAVDTAIEAVNSALAGGMSWTELEAMIKEERRLGNPVAAMIKSLDLANNEITINLENHLDELDEDEDESNGASGRKKRVAVSVDLGLSAHANASVRFAAKKKNADKFEKTMNAQNKAIAAAEAKMKSAIERAENAPTVTRARQTLWFEKFHWFITSENCLVIQAKDAPQAEMIIARYMLPGDAFVHADVPQAPVTVVKPPPGGDVRAVPAYSLVQAGAAVMCRSGAWTSRAVKSAWWTTADRVSKISPVAGDRLLPGVVHVAHSDKQFLPHSQLIMGFGFMFVVSEKSAEAHKNDRLVRSDFNILEGDDLDGGEGEDEDDEIVGQDDGEDEGSADEETTDAEVGKLAAFLDGAVGFAGENLKKDEDETEDDGDGDNEKNDSDEHDEPSAAAQNNKSAPRLSAKERKSQKKKKKGGAGHGDDDSEDDDFVDPLAAMSGKKTATAKSQDAGAKPLPRGKAAKLKRAKAKYADQDDEDRELAMSLLGASGGKSAPKGMTKKAARTAEKAAMEFEERKLAKPAAPRAPEPAPPAFRQRREVAAVKKDADHGSQHVVVEQDETPLEERLKIEAERLAVVNRIVASPFRDDEIEYCLPVCAPIAATNALKYRMKVTPGAQKKGKAAKLAVEILLRAPFATRDELAALRLVSEADAATCLPPGCKISMPPGAAKILSNAKKSHASAAKKGKSRGRK